MSDRLLTRAQLRQALRHKRRTLSAIQQQQAALRLSQKLAQHPLFLRSQRIAMYLASDGEINLQPLITRAQQMGKQVYVPVLKKWPQQHMVFQQLSTNGQWHTNRFGIREPLPNPKLQVKPWVLDLVLLPLVGFDQKGGRLGMGGGFYDRHFAYLRQRQTWQAPVLAGVAHQSQEVAEIPVQSWDIPLNWVFTD